MDLNAEAIQICQLSLWIKTAARGKQLTSLDHTIREGNSVISDPAVHPKAFDWQAACPEVFAQGGFDVVILFVYPSMSRRGRILTDSRAFHRPAPRTPPSPLGQTVVLKAWTGGQHRALPCGWGFGPGGCHHLPRSTTRPGGICGTRFAQRLCCIGGLALNAGGLKTGLVIRREGRRIAVGGP